MDSILSEEEVSDKKEGSENHGNRYGVIGVLCVLIGVFLFPLKSRKTGVEKKRDIDKNSNHEEDISNKVEPNDDSRGKTGSSNGKDENEHPDDTSDKREPNNEDSGGPGNSNEESVNEHPGNNYPSDSVISRGYNRALTYEGVVREDNAVLDSIIKKLTSNPKQELSADEDKFYKNHYVMIQHLLHSSTDSMFVVTGGNNKSIKFANGEFSIDGFNKYAADKKVMTSSSVSYATVNGEDIAKANKLIKDNKIPGCFYGYSDALVRGVGNIVKQDIASFDDRGDSSLSSVDEGLYIDLMNMSKSSLVVCINRPVLLYPIFSSNSLNIIGAPFAISVSSNSSYGYVTIEPAIINNCIAFSNYIVRKTIKGKKILFCRQKAVITESRYDSKIIKGVIRSFFVKPVMSSTVINVFERK